MKNIAESTCIFISIVVLFLIYIPVTVISFLMFDSEAVYTKTYRGNLIKE